MTQERFVRPEGEGYQPTRAMMHRALTSDLHLYFEVDAYVDEFGDTVIPRDIAAQVRATLASWRVNDVTGNTYIATTGNFIYAAQGRESAHSILDWAEEYLRSVQTATT